MRPERRLDLPGDGEIVENGYVSLVELDDVFRLGCDECNVVAHFFVDLLVVDVNAFKRGVEEVAKQSYRAAGFFVNKRGFIGRILFCTFAKAVSQRERRMRNS